MSSDDGEVSETHGDGEAAERLPGQDWVLEDIVEMLNGADTDGGFGATLYVHGMIVSGTMIGGREYFEKYGEIWASMVGEEHRERVKQVYSEPAEFYGPEGSRTAQPAYIHLRDAQVFSAGGAPIPRNTGVLWRGKIASIDAFSIGKLHTLEQ